MTPEGIKALKKIVKDLLDYVEFPETFSEYLEATIAEKNGDEWIVYFDGNSKASGITTTGHTAYEARENAWMWFEKIIDECKNT